MAPGQTVIIPVNFTNTDSSGNPATPSSSASLQEVEAVITFNASQLKVASGVFTATTSGGSGTSDGSVSLGKITDEPGTSPVDGKPWAFTTNFVDNFDNTPTGSNLGVMVVTAARQGTVGLPEGANDFGAGSVFLIAFQVVGSSPATAAINLQANTAGTNFSNGTTGALSTDPVSGANLGQYSLTGGPSNAGPSNTPGNSLDTAVTIANLDNTTTLTGPAIASYGQSATFKATVAATNSSAPMDGTVTFYDGGTSLGTRSSRGRG